MGIERGSIIPPGENHEAPQTGPGDKAERSGPQHRALGV